MQGNERSRERRFDWLARAALTLGALLPYWPVLGLHAIHVTDDVFMSDVWNGELPFRVLQGAGFREHGQVLRWTSQLCSGAPVVGGDEPLTLLFFSALPVAAALDLLLISWILVAAHGAYFLARRAHADRAGAVLCGIAFAVSGYMVAQLKHLAIIGTVVWLPLGLALLDRALGRQVGPRIPAWARLRDLALFGLVFAEQALVGFPQSAYICGLCYGAYALFCACLHPLRRALAALAAVSVVGALGVLGGAITLLPLAATGEASDRAGPVTFEWASRVRYWPRDALTFLSPYVNGDVSDATFHGPALFWEDYGYVGLGTFLLALYAIVRVHRAQTWFFLALGVCAYLLVLGPATPVYQLAFEHLPGMQRFRFPTRFLIVVELALCVLAALGLSRLVRDVSARVRRPAELGVALAVGLCLATELDLLVHQPRQNPFVDASMWLAPPRTVSTLRAEGIEPRVYTPYHMRFHLEANTRARNWTTTQPYFALGDLLQPNSNAYWGIASADCYAGVAPRWYVDAWGDHNRPSRVVASTIRLSARPSHMDTSPSFTKVMRTFGVTHVISPYTIAVLEPPIESNTPARNAHVYRVPEAKRVRVVPNAIRAPTDIHAVAWLLRTRFDPENEVILRDAPAELERPPTIFDTQSSARVVRDDGDELVVSAVAPSAGFLVLSDTYFPGWQAMVDGKPAPIYRANVYVRAVALPAGKHTVRFAYRPSALARGRVLSVSAVSLLVALFALAQLALWRARRSATGSAS